MGDRFRYVLSAEKVFGIILFHKKIFLGQENIINGINATKSGQEGVESNHWAVELADWKARLRKQRQELLVLNASFKNMYL